MQFTLLPGIGLQDRLMPDHPAGVHLLAQEIPVASKASLSVFDAIMIMVGMVVGIGIFRTPSLVAANVESASAFIAVWIAGGLVTLIGALCYAELSSTYPHSGGEYHFLSRAYGKSTAVMFGWARGSVIQTGAIATVAFAFGDYAVQVLPQLPFSPAGWAAFGIVTVTGVNLIGTVQSKRLQIVMTLIQAVAIITIIGFGLLSHVEPAQSPPALIEPGAAALGLAMVFVLLTYGGWNEAAYLTGELKDAPRNIVRVLVIGTAILVSIYVLLNFAMLSVLGLDGLRQAPAVATDTMHAVAGPSGAMLVSVGIMIAAISTLNATIFTGARVYYAMARDLVILPRVGKWNERGKTPANALMMQAVVALGLVALGAATRNGFQAMVDYTAPVFWGFMLLVGLSVFVLRFREPDQVRPFRVPLYPLTPILFCATCAYMLHASVVHTGVASLIGLGVLVAGAPLLLFRRQEENHTGAALAPARAPTE